jgi:TonB family protein
MKRLLNILILILAFSLAAFAQTPTARDQAMELYKQKNYSAAAQALQSLTKTNKKDAEIWNLLGLAYLNLNNFKQSRKALGTAVKLNPQDSNYRANMALANLASNKLKPAAKEADAAIRLDAQNAEAYYVRGNINLRQGKFADAISDADRAIKIKPAFAAPYLIKADGYLYSFGEELARGVQPSDQIDLLKKAMETLEGCLNDCEKNSALQAQQETLGAVKAFYNYFSRNKNAAIEPALASASIDTSITPIKILTKPRANYTDSAKQANIQGTVRVAVYFSADGKAKYVMVVKPLSNGLSEEAIRAARQITFEPQLKDGKPVSVIKMVEYIFTLY